MDAVAKASGDHRAERKLCEIVSTVEFYINVVSAPRSQQRASCEESWIHMILAHSWSWFRRHIISISCNFKNSHNKEHWLILIELHSFFAWFATFPELFSQSWYCWMAPEGRPQRGTRKWLHCRDPVWCSLSDGSFIWTCLIIMTDIELCQLHFNPSHVLFNSALTPGMQPSKNGIVLQENYLLPSSGGEVSWFNLEKNTSSNNLKKIICIPEPRLNCTQCWHRTGTWCALLFGLLSASRS